MSVIIRLQNLPWAANASDIRAYFHGLSIPEGGVHIVGGEQGDAFIAFSTDEDARQAMLRDGGKLKEVMIKLFLSSRTEMLKVIEQARQQTLSLQQLIHASVTPAQQSPPQENQNEAAPTSGSVTDDNDRNKDDGSEKDRRERRRSRSRGRDRDRSRDRSRRDRDRERRRRDRSRSRDRYRSRRSKSRDRERRGRSREKSRDRGDSRRSKGRDDFDSRKDSTDQQWDAAPPKKTLLPDPVPKPEAPPVIPEVSQIPENIQMGKMEGMTPEMLMPTEQPPMNFMGDFPMMPGFPGAIPPGLLGPGMTPPGMFPNMPMRGITRDWPPGPMPTMGFPRPGMPPGMPPEMMPMAPFPQTAMPPFPQAGMPPNWAFPAMGGKVEPPDSNTCVEIHGLPLNVNYVDVKKLFEGVPIASDGIKMINDTQGNRTGIAYVKFMQPSFKNTALAYSGRMVKGNSVEIMHLKESIFNSAIDNFQPEKELDKKPSNGELKNGVEEIPNWQRPHMKFHDPRLMGKGGGLLSPPTSRDTPPLKRPQSDCVLLQGLPLKCSERDIFDFFSELGVAPIHIHIVLDNSGHPVGDVFCQFETPLEAEKAAVKDKSNMGRHTVTVKIIAREELDKVRSGDRKDKNDRPVERGDPRAERNNQRMERSDPRMERPDGRNERMERGDPRMDRSDPRMDRGDPRMDRGDSRMDRGDPRMDRGDPRMDRGESRMDRADPRMERGDMRMDRAETRGDRIERGDNRMDRNDPRMERGPRMDRGDPRMDRGEGMGYPAPRGGGGFRPPYRGGMESTDMEERGPREERFRGDHGMGGRGRGMRGRGDMMRGRGGGRGRGDMMGGRGSRRPPSPYIDNEAVDKFGRPGCVVALENIHFRANIEEILEFFSDFEIDHEDVIRRFDEVGRPTGDARVALKTPEDAERAVRELSYQQIRGRPITLSIVPQ